MSLLALSVQVYGNAAIAERIPAGAFFPVPKVDSAVVLIEVYPASMIPAAHLDKFFRLIRAGFHQKRKTLRNALAAGLKIPPAKADSLLANVGIDPRRRAETLSLQEWRNLCESW
jgi:16S rRNA (adenine1518-N6/adenine1519-N6)-dimethyltransferase